MTEPATASFVPDTCTLPTAEQPRRVDEFDELYRTAVRGVRRVGSTRIDLDLVPAPANAARAAELSARETACCSFFTFTLAIGARSLVLSVEAPPAQADVLAAAADRAESVATQLASNPA